MTAEYKMKWAAIVICRTRGYPQSIIAAIRDAKNKKEVREIMKNAAAQKTE